MGAFNPKLSMGLFKITDRANIVDAVADVDLDIPRAGNVYVTAP